MPPFFVILWGYLGPVPPSPSYPIFVCTICKCLIFLVNLSSWFLYWVWFLWLSRPQLFGAYCAWIIGIFSSAGKLGIFFPFPKFHFDEFNSFYCVCPSFSHTYVIALLSFYVVCFCCGFLIVFHVFFLIIRFILIVADLIGLFCLFVIVSCDIILNFHVGLVVNILISCDFID